MNVGPGYLKTCEDRATATHKRDTIDTIIEANAYSQQNIINSTNNNTFASAASPSASHEPFPAGSRIDRYFPEGTLASLSTLPSASRRRQHARLPSACLPACLHLTSPRPHPQAPHTTPTPHLHRRPRIRPHTPCLTIRSITIQEAVPGLVLRPSPYPSPARHRQRRLAASQRPALSVISRTL